MQKAQSTIEYAMVIFAITVALLAMQVYMQRAMQGKLKDLADDLGKQQYVPGSMESNMTTEHSSNVTTVVHTEDLGEEGTETTTNIIINNETEHQYGYELLE